MKRSPLVRRTPLARSGRLAPMSERRRRLLPARARVRAVVLARHGWRCAAEGIAPGPCGFLPGRGALEVDERSGGAARGAEWLDPDKCQPLCPVHHDWKHANPADAYRLGLPVRTDHRPEGL